MLKFMLMKFFLRGGGRRVKSWTGDVEVHAYASYMKYSMSARLRWCMQHYRRNSLYWRALISLFKIQMTQYWSIPLSCSGSSSCNCLPALFHHDFLHEGEFLYTDSEFLIKLKNLPHFMKPPRLITTYTTARHLILYRSWSVHFMVSHNIL
jgi:hypothetical protein